MALTWREAADEKIPDSLNGLLRWSWGAIRFTGQTPDRRPASGSSPSRPAVFAER